MIERCWRFCSRSLPRRVATAVVVVVSVLIVVSVVGARSGDRVAGQPDLDVPQDAVAADDGITIRATAAAFSGTATYVDLRVDVDSAGQVLPTVVRFPEEAFADSPLKPWGGQGGVHVDDGRTESFPLRLTPIDRGGPFALRIGVVDVDFSDGTSRRYDGDWDLQLIPPDDIGDALRTENLVSEKSTVSDYGLDVSLVSAQRSRTESLVTVRFEPSVNLGDFREFDLPRITSTDGTTSGVRIDASDDGQVVTYLFRPTPFGEPVQLDFGPFATARATDTFVDLDLHAVLTRNGLTGKFRETAPVESGDVAVTGAGETTITGITFARTGDGGPATLLDLTLRGAFEGESIGEFRLVLASGDEVLPEFMSSKTQTGPAGTQSGDQTTMGFPFSDLDDDLDGHVTLYVGSELTILNGSWQMTLSPAD